MLDTSTLWSHCGHTTVTVHCGYMCTRRVHVRGGCMRAHTHRCTRAQEVFGDYERPVKGSPFRKHVAYFGVAQLVKGHEADTVYVAEPASIMLQKVHNDPGRHIFNRRMAMYTNRGDIDSECCRFSHTPPPRAQMLDKEEDFPELARDERNLYYVVTTRGRDRLIFLQDVYFTHGTAGINSLMPSGS